MLRSHTLAPWWIGAWLRWRWKNPLCSDTEEWKCPERRQMFRPSCPEQLDVQPYSRPFYQNNKGISLETPEHPQLFSQSTHFVPDCPQCKFVSVVRHRQLQIKFFGKQGQTTWRKHLHNWTAFGDSTAKDKPLGFVSTFTSLIPDSAKNVLMGIASTLVVYVPDSLDRNR